MALTGGSQASVVPRGGIILWSGSIASIPTGWQLCDGTNGTPDLRNRFIVCAGDTYAVNDTGGTAQYPQNDTSVNNTVHTPGVTVCQDNPVVDVIPDTYLVSDLFDIAPPYYALAYIQRL